MKRIITVFFLTMVACCFWWLQITSAYAREYIILTEEQEKYPLGLHLEYLEDPTGGMTIDDVTSTDYETRFIPSEADIPTIGFSNSAYWVRVQLRHEGHEQTDWRLAVNSPYLDVIDLYLADAKGQFQAKQAGDQRSFDDWEIEHRFAVFKVAIPPQSQQILYLRIQSTGLVFFDLTLWTADAFNASASHRQFFF